MSWIAKSCHHSPYNTNQEGLKKKKKAMPVIQLIQSLLGTRLHTMPDVSHMLDRQRQRQRQRKRRAMAGSNHVNVAISEVPVNPMNLKIRPSIHAHCTP